MTQVLPFDEVFEDESGGNIKTLQSDYLVDGQIPIVDQGKDLIGGFTNDSSRICKSRLPVIVFGDHTKCLKFVDFPFAMGADGVKVLKPKVEANAKYLYYYLRSLNIPDAGYSRHFKYLKRTNIWLPPLDEQKRIAEVLDKADALRQKRRLALQKLDTLLQSVFLEMFGDPVSNPQGWSLAKLGDLTTYVSSGVTPLGGNSTYLSEGVPFIRSQNVLMNRFDFDDIAFISPATHRQMSRTWVKKGDVLFNITGASIGRVNYYPGDDDSANVNQHVCIIRPERKSILPEFISYYLSMPSFQSLILNRNAGATRQAFNYQQIRNFDVIVPPLEKQMEFSEIRGNLDRMRTRMTDSEQKCGRLFSSIQDRAFKGELFESLVPSVGFAP